MSYPSSYWVPFLVISSQDGQACELLALVNHVRYESTAIFNWLFTIWPSDLLISSVVLARLTAATLVPIISLKLVDFQHTSPVPSVLVQYISVSNSFSFFKLPGYCFVTHTRDISRLVSCVFPGVLNHPTYPFLFANHFSSHTQSIVFCPRLECRLCCDLFFSLRRHPKDHSRGSEFWRLFGSSWSLKERISKKTEFIYHCKRSSQEPLDRLLSPSFRSQGSMSSPRVYISLLFKSDTFEIYVFIKY